MNNSTFEIEKIYERIGSTWLLDSIYIFVIAPIGFIGGCLNLLAFFILVQIKIKQTMLYKYLCFYSLNGTLLCFLFTTIFTAYSPRYYPYFFSYFSRINRAFSTTIITTSLYFIGNLLDFIIVLDRLSIFVKRLKPINKLNPYFICFMITIISLITNLPVYFSYYIKDDNEIGHEIKYNISTFTYNGRTPFFYSQIGTIITYIQIFIRDILTLLMELVISSLAFYYFKKFIKNQIEMTTNHHQNVNTINLNHQKIVNKKVLKDRQLLLFNLIQSLLSFVSHLFVCLSYFYASQGVSTGLFNSLCIGYFAICFKHFSNYFLLFFFNSNFRKQFYISFRTRTEISSITP